jgi:hypothetical protein
VTGKGIELDEPVCSPGITQTRLGMKRAAAAAGRAIKIAEGIALIWMEQLHPSPPAK